MVHKVLVRNSREYLILTLGVLLTALGLDLFLVPNKIAAGGVSGIATIIFHLVGFPVGITILALNVPLFLWGLYKLGLQVGFRSLYGTVTLSLFVDGLAPYLPVATRDALLASLFGGVLVGLGLGLVFRSKGTTGGTDFAALIVRRYVGINVGQLLFLIDASVVLAAGIAFRSYELALYALITIFVTAWIIDTVQDGISFTKAFFIISSYPDQIAGKINTELDRGATIWRGTGAYTGAERDVLLTVVSRSEVTRLKDLVHEIDPRAFVVVTDVREVFGEGFKRLEPGKT